MGAKESILKDVEVGEPLPEDCTLYKMWTSVFPGRYARDRSQVSIFIRDFAETDSTETQKFFENGLQMLKQLRHPSILSYCASSVSKAEACLVTERVQPLDLAIDNLEPVEILAGIINILDALIFLHDKAGLCHNNVCPSAIFVSCDGSWKLGFFECALRLENSRHWVLSDFVKAIKEPVFVPPEDQQMMKIEVPAHARDSYGFGKVMEYLVPYLEQYLQREQKEALDEVIETLTMDEPSLRPQLGALSGSDKSLCNDLTELSTFLQNIPLKSEDQKHIFFRGLVARLRKLCPIVLARRLTKVLLSRYVLLEPAAIEHLLPSLLEPKDESSEESLEGSEGPLLPAGLFRKHVIPELARIFCVHETSVRLALLSHFHCYVESFGRTTLENIVLPELLLGMKDTDEEIVSASMRCLADVVPLLGAPTVTGMSHRKYFAEGRPRFEANKLILEPGDLKNVKAALQSDSRSAQKYDESERRKQRERRAEDRRKLLEQKRKDKKHQLAANRKTVKAVKESPLLQPEDTEAGLGQYVGAAIMSRPPPVEGNSDGVSAKTEDPDWRNWEEEETEESTMEATPKESKESTAPPPKSAPISDIRISTESTGKAASLKLETNRKSSNKKQMSPTQKQKTESLGSEFDVMAIEVDKESIGNSEPDYFADMEPEIAKTPADKWDLHGREQKGITKPKNLFEMAADDSAGDTVGWDDDGWGD